MTIRRHGRSFGLLVLCGALGACSGGEAGTVSMDAGLADSGHMHEHDAGLGHGKLGIHIHNIQFWGTTKNLLIGAHEGVYRTEVGAEELVTLAEEGDYMSVMQDDGDTWELIIDQS